MFAAFDADLLHESGDGTEASPSSGLRTARRLPLGGARLLRKIVKFDMRHQKGTGRISHLSAALRPMHHTPLNCPDNMPPLQGFSDNPLRIKEDLVLTSEALLKPLIPYFSPNRAGIKLPVESGTHFDETAAQLEGFARPLWAVATLLADPEYSQDSRGNLLQSWVDGIGEGIDPSSSEYWGDIGDWDQRMVEAEIVSFALLTSPARFYDPLTGNRKEKLKAWLLGMNGKVMPENNWRWFRVLSNLALIKVCGCDRGTLWPLMEKDLQVLESFYLSCGWSADGVWRSSDGNTGPDASRSRQADYYSGSFAIQFSQMLYAMHASEIDPERSALFQARAREFARSFWSYFDTDGSAIPFGRSLTYRFAMGAFYAAFAYTGLCDDSEYILSHGAVKGMLLRHLRWWACNSDNITATDGTLNIGYAYPNMYLSEDYNSPQSPYWALKAFLIVGLDSSHAFWRSEELPHPLSNDAACITSEKDNGDVLPVQPARQILCNHHLGNHHFALSSGQFCVWPMKAAQAKYGKFAYSSAFGFSVPTGNLITQIAPDNTLALSIDDGESWAVRWKSIGETRFVDYAVGRKRVPALASSWKPWSSGNVEVETTLVSPSSEWPDWHVRIHRIRGYGAKSLLLSSVEGGFAIAGCHSASGRSLWRDRTRANSDAIPELSTFRDEQGALETPSSSLVISKAGASGVLNLFPCDLSANQSTCMGEVLKVDPNTNLMTPRTLLPALTRKSCVESGPYPTIILATGVFAISSQSKHVSCGEILKRWTKRPKIEWTSDGTFTVAS